MRYLRQLIIFVSLLTLCGCEDTSYHGSSVPTYPVRVTIDTKAVFVDFTRENLNAYITVDKDWYKENGKNVHPTLVTDAWGYGGVVVYISMFGYDAYDLGCPYCAGRGHKSPCEMHGIYAECPRCGETYDLGCGYALPTTGLSREALRRYKTTFTGDKIIVTQQ